VCPLRTLLAFPVVASQKVTVLSFPPAVIRVPPSGVKARPWI
jgi:hypothetical protein